MTYEKVKCPICGLERASLAKHMLHVHKITKQQFKDEYPEYSLVADVVRDRARATCKKQWEDDYYKKLANTHSLKSKLKRREKRIRNAKTIEERFKKGRTY